MESRNPTEISPDAYEEAAWARRIASVPPGEAAGEEAKLYRRLAPRVRIYGLRHLRDPEAAADLVQDVLLMTIERLRGGRVREVGHLPSFVLGICRMVIRDKRRKDDRRGRLLMQFRDSIPTADIAVPPRVDSERLKVCLDKLAERDRTIVVMDFAVERSTAEIASELGLSVDHVRVIRHRALGRLRKCMTGKAE